MPLKNIWIYLIFYVLLIGSCTTENVSEIINIDRLTKSKNLSGTTIQVPVNILAPSAMTIVSDKLIILDYDQEGLFKVFELPNLEFLYSWGNIGKGPSEFVSIDNNSFNFYGNSLQVFDNNIIKFLSVNDEQMQLTKSIKLPIFANPINRLQRLNDSLFVADNFFEESTEHIIINTINKQIIKEFGDYPVDDLNINNPLERYQIYNKSVVSNPEGDKFVAFYYYFPRIKFYNSTELKRNIKLNISGIKEYSIEKKDHNLIHFALPYSTAKYIYVFWINLTDGELEQNLDKFNPELFIWDWSGELIERYKLDAPVTSFAVSEKNKKLYGTNYLNENEIFIYELPFLK